MWEVHFLYVQPLAFGNAPKDKVICFKACSVRFITIISWNRMTRYVPFFYIKSLCEVRILITTSWNWNLLFLLTDKAHEYTSLKNFRPSNYKKISLCQSKDFSQLIKSFSRLYIWRQIHKFVCIKLLKYMLANIISFIRLFSILQNLTFVWSYYG